MWFGRFSACAIILVLDVFTANAAAQDVNAHEDVIEPSTTEPSTTEPSTSKSFAEAPAKNCGKGPRRVPKPRGSAQKRAKALGLGTRQTATHLLSHVPKPSWVRAASGGRKVKRLSWPVRNTRVGRGFGLTREENADVPHRGLDLVAQRGVSVHAAADGIVAYSDNGVCGYGNVILVVHPNGWVTLYAHNDRNTVQAGYRVRRGERIALAGATGHARGPHLHFELHERGRAIDPLPFIGKPSAKRTK